MKCVSEASKRRQFFSVLEKNNVVSVGSLLVTAVCLPITCTGFQECDIFQSKRYVGHLHFRWKPRGGPSTKEPCPGSTTRQPQKSGIFRLPRLLPKTKRAPGTLSNNDRSLERRRELYEKFAYRGAGKRAALATPPDARKPETGRLAGDQERCRTS